MAAYLGRPDTVDIAQLVDEVGEEVLLRSAASEGVRGLVAYVVTNSLGSKAAPKCLQAFQEEFARNGIYVGEMMRLDEALAERGMQAIILKGGALLHHGYAQMGVRFLSDIDVMVRQQELPPMRDLLEDLGFQSGDGINFRRDMLAIDLHYEPIKRLATAFVFSTDDLWNNSLPLDPNRYQALRRLGPYDQFLHHAIHGLGHAYYRMSWLVDLAVAIDHLDPHRLWQRAQETHSERALSYALSLVRDLFGVPLPPALESRLCRPNRWERWFLARVKERGHPETIGKVIAVFSIRNWLMRAVHLWRIGRPQAGASWKQRLKELYSMLTRVWAVYRSTPS